MKNMFALIGLSLVFYFILFYMIKIRKIKCGGNHFKIIIPILTVLSVANNLLAIKYNFFIKTHFLILQNLLLAVIIPVYYVYLKFNIKISKLVEFLFTFIGIILFLKIVIISGIRSIVFPLIYLVMEFIHANNIDNIKKMKFNFSISYIELYNNLSSSDKIKYKDTMLKAVTALFAIIMMNMMTVSQKSFIYQTLFITFISFMFIRNIKNKKFKNIFIRKRK